MAYYGDQNKGGVNGHYYHVFGTVCSYSFNAVDSFPEGCSVAIVLQDPERRGFVAVIMPIRGSKDITYVYRSRRIVLYGWHCVVFGIQQSNGPRQYNVDE